MTNEKSLRTRSNVLSIAVALTAVLGLAPGSLAAQTTTTTEPAVTSPPEESVPTGGLGLTSTETHETVCTGGQDEDGDGLVDCADSDCYGARNCQAGQAEERTPQACSDWIDNDGDGATDCDDTDCTPDLVPHCRGSWQGNGAAADTSGGSDDLPEIPEGTTSLEDLIGRNGDVDGERTDETCADGMDNDFDGRTDCQDIGCRFDPNVTVCQGTPGLRFSVVAGVGGRLTWNYDQAGNNTGNIPDAGFTLLQLRALGPIPLIQNSFFMLNVRADDRVRLTFALFQIPISNRGHYLALNSGFGTLTTGLIISAARHPLLEPAYYLTTAFEQGNGAAVEQGGPIDDSGILNYRLFGAAGSGEFNGNVGGRFFRSDDRNFAYTLGGQLQLDAVGHWTRLDSPYIYTPVPLTVGFNAGFKFDQRPDEQFVAFQASGLFRFWHFFLRAETIGRYVMPYNASSAAWNVQLSALLVPRVLMFAGDIGGFYQLGAYQNLPAGAVVPAGVNYIPEQFQFRAALHWYFYRQVGIASLVYRELHNGTDPTNPTLVSTERELRLETRFRF